MNKLHHLKFFLLFFLFSLLLQKSVKAEESCACLPAADSLQLVDFYAATNGVTWTNQWNTSLPMENWFGVVLTPDRCVQKLNMYVSFGSSIGNGLTGFIPDLQLPELTDLVLQGNAVSGNLPSFLGLPKLKNLNLNGNNIAGSLPDFSNNPDLVNIDMDGNAISGFIPNFSNLPDLISLSLFFCNLSGSIPDFSNTPNLQYIYLGQNNLNGILPDFTNLPKLRVLNLSNNALWGDLFDFSNTPLLEELFLGNNDLTGDLIDFQNTPLLRSLELKENNITGIIPDFSGLPFIQNLQIGFNDFQGIIPDFSSLPNLKLLDISQSNLTGNIPSFSNCPLLEKLSLIGNELEGDVPDLSSLPLVTLRLQGNNLSGLPDLSALNNWGDFISNGFVVNNNQLTFEDILPNMSAQNSGFWKYAPQDSIGTESVEILVPGSDYNIDLGIDENTITNTYDWYKDGIFYQQIIGDNKLPFSNLQNTDEGVYTCIITNSGAPALTLHSRPVTLTLCIQATDAIATNTGFYCDNEPIQLNATIDTEAALNVEYQWSNANGYSSNEIAPSDATEAGLYTFIAVLDGCPSIPVTTEVQIFETPSPPIINGNTTICEGASFQLSTPSVVNVEYNWTGTLGFISNEENPIISTAATPNMSGIYSLTLNNSGCVSPPTSININVMALADASFEYADNCEGQSIFPENIGTTGGQFSFAVPPSDAAVINVTTGEISNTTAGNLYEIAYTLNSNTACPSQQTAFFTVLEEPDLQDIQTVCAPNLLSYNVYFSSNASNITSNFGDVAALNNGNWQIENIPTNTPIQVNAAIENALCSTQIDIAAPNCECPIIGAPIAAATNYSICEGEEIPTLTVEVVTNYTANWFMQATGGTAIAEGVLTYTPNSSNTFYVETFDPITNCVSETRTALFFEISEVPEIEIYSITCDTLNNSYTVDFYSTSENVTVSEGNLTLLLDNNYRVENVRETSDLEIFATISTCQSSLYIPTPNCYCDRIARIEKAPPSCYGEADGYLLLEKGTHYNSPVEILLNGELYSTNTNLPIIISNLKAGIYNFIFTDQEGCKKTEEIELEQPRELTLNLGGHQEIFWGEEVEIEAITNIENILSITWYGALNSLSCTDCLSPVASPQESSYYRLTLEEEDGCTVSEELRIFVNQKTPYYAPTAFSPNADGQNDYFTIYGDATRITMIKNIQIFDRWGNQLFARTDILPNEETEGWNGDFRGKEMGEGVYVWLAELEFFNGKKEKIQGSVSLLR